MPCLICWGSLFTNVDADWEQQAAALLCGHVFHQSYVDEEDSDSASGQVTREALEEQLASEKAKVAAGRATIKRLRASRQQLERMLRKERAKLAAQGALNADLAARVAELKKNNAGASAVRGRRRRLSAADEAQAIDLMSDTAADLDLDEGQSLFYVDDTQVVDLASDATIDLDLDEDD
ncbi:hypothetical protein IWQ57_004061 [Coemansia nantahalensis]|uniref:Uncharacterized protein n=1 Tax=Coemansia nantahalensis TaxID=2789366 RepID=A0ACC1JTU1_9FUNG|nr:hypothetical protein IWQ57_004061 [Coemansia nantahalensis]